MEQLFITSASVNCVLLQILSRVGSNMTTITFSVRIVWFLRLTTLLPVPLCHHEERQCEETVRRKTDHTALFVEMVSC